MKTFIFVGKVHFRNKGWVTGVVFEVDWQIMISYLNYLSFYIWNHKWRLQKYRSKSLSPAWKNAVFQNSKVWNTIFFPIWKWLLSLKSTSVKQIGFIIILTMVWKWYRKNCVESHLSKLFFFIFWIFLHDYNNINLWIFNMTKANDFPFKLGATSS